MLISYNKLIGKPIISIQDGQNLGYVEYCLFNQNLELEAIKIKTGFLSSKFIERNNIKKFGADALMVDDKTVLVSKNKIASLQNRSESSNQFIKKLKGFKAVTLSGTFLGKINDFNFDDVFGKVVNLETKKGLFSKELLISKDQIVSIGKNFVVVEDAVLPKKVQVEPV